MSGFEELKVTFFEESSELLVQLEAGLNAMQSHTGDDDTVHGIFRAVHSIKGGAGVFGFEELIEFAHVFETTMDAVRQGSLEPSPDVIDVLFLANDTLVALVDCARDGKAVEAGFGSESRMALERLIDPSGANAAADACEPEELEGLDFMPVAIDDFDFGDDRSDHAITFRPKASMIRKAIEPATFIGRLRALGDLELVADTSTVPALHEMQAEQAYLGWTATLRTMSGRDEILGVFAAIADDCDLEIIGPEGQGVVAYEPPSFDEPAAFDAPSVIEELPAVAAFVPEPVLSPAPALAPIAMPTPTQAAKPMPPAPIAPVAKASSDEAPPSAAASQSAGGAKAASNATIRVELEKIDRVVNMVGELVIAQAMFGQIIETLPEEVSERMANVLSDLVRHTRGLKDSVMAIRAQPVSSVFQRMPRLVRELAAKTGKKVQVETSGETTEVDKTIIERLSDPLTHIIRNSIDHGIETPAQRIASRKPETGTIRLSADQRGGRIVIEISDDGAGINCERVLRKAIERGLVDANAKLSDDEICNLIFLPGFSTAETVSDISGRGVGMDVVRRNIQDLGGRTSIKSDAGRGMTIQLMLPLTLAVMDGMVVEVNKQAYVLPIPNVVECLRPKADDIHHLLGTDGTLQLRGEIVPLIHLGALLGVAPIRKDVAARIVIIVESSDGTRLGLIVDDLCGHQQVVIKSIEENCGVVRGIAGATILGDGHVSFILDVEALSEMTSSETKHPVGAASRAAAA